MLRKVTVETPKKGCLVEITETVKNIVAESGVQDGMVVVMTTDVNASILITSFYDSKGHEDIIDDFVRIFPARDNFHFGGSVTDGAAHSMSSVTGQTAEFIVCDGDMKLGVCTGILFAEYKGAKRRE